jgi:ComF family protein
MRSELFRNVQSFSKKSALIKKLILDLVFPLECLGCGIEGFWICPDCFKNIRMNTVNECPHCRRKNASGETCDDCRADHFLDGLSVASDYNDIMVAEMIKIFKYRFAKDLAAEIGTLMVDNIFAKNQIKDASGKFGSFIPPSTIMIPVPLSRKRLNWRGFNQAEEIARAIAEAFDLRIEGKSLVRSRHTIPQAKLKREERIKNVKDCFVWKGKRLRGDKILLVDDVATTGATLEECARILKGHGAAKVWGLVAARGS